MKAIIFHAEAKAEMIASAQYYEARSEGVGRRFLGEVDHALLVIADSPQSWPYLWGAVRRYLLSQFPFAVLYQVYEDHVYILAIMHLSRNPNYWKHRLEA
jgi:hypothetical protein